MSDRPSKDQGRVAIIGAVGVPANYGGFETLVDCLINAGDRPDGVFFSVYCSSFAFREHPVTWRGARLHYVRLRANGWQSAIYDGYSLVHAAVKGYRKVLVLGVSGGLFFVLLRIFFPRVKIFVNVDGCEWRREKWGMVAKAVLYISEWVAVRGAHSVIADNKVIGDQIYRRYGKRTEVIEYGGDNALTEPLPSDNGRYYALCVARIEPENNIHLILEAFVGSKEHLKIVGNWDISNYGRNLRAAYASCENMELLDPTYEKSRLFKLRSECGLYIHGHMAGGTNPSLVEIMHFGKPVVAFDCDYNHETTEGEALFFRDAVSLAQVVASRDWESVGPALQAIARKRYCWNVIKSKYFELLGLESDDSVERRVGPTS